MRSIQVANTSSGEYDVRKPLPYPFHVEDDGTIARQDFWRGEPARLAGFQSQADVQHVDLLAEDWLAGKGSAVGMFPVFIDADGGVWNHKHPITSETDR